MSIARTTLQQLLQRAVDGHCQFSEEQVLIAQAIVGVWPSAAGVWTAVPVGLQKAGEKGVAQARDALRAGTGGVADSFCPLSDAHAFYCVRSGSEPHRRMMVEITNPAAFEYAGEVVEAYETTHEPPCETTTRVIQIDLGSMAASG
jgi:hypothetical protein